MVGVAGFEPATPASRTRCSTRLSHTPKLGGRLIEEGREGDKAARATALASRRCTRRPLELSPPACAAGPSSGRAGGVPAGEWCNGNTAVFGTVILGSSPSSPATPPPRSRMTDRPGSKGESRHHHRGTEVGLPSMTDTPESVLDRSPHGSSLRECSNLRCSTAAPALSGRRAPNDLPTRTSAGVPVYCAWAQARPSALP